MRDHAFEISGFGGRFGDSQSNHTMQVATRSDEDDSTTTLRLPTDYSPWTAGADLFVTQLCLLNPQRLRLACIAPRGGTGNECDKIS